MKSVIAFSILMLIGGCGGGLDGGIKLLPSLLLECPAKDLQGCKTSAPPAFVGLAPMSIPSCEEYIYPLISKNLRQSGFIASTNISSIKTDLIHWTDANGSPASHVLTGRYKVCAFIDSNRNDRLDAGEPVAESRMTAGSNTLHISQWHSCPLSMGD